MVDANSKIKELNRTVDVKDAEITRLNAVILANGGTFTAQITVSQAIKVLIEAIKNIVKG